MRQLIGANCAEKSLVFVIAQIYLYWVKEITKWLLKSFGMMLTEIKSTYQMWILATQNQNFLHNCKFNIFIGIV